MNTSHKKNVSTLLLLTIFSLVVFFSATAADVLEEKDHPMPPRDHPSDTDVPSHDYLVDQDQDRIQDRNQDQNQDRDRDRDRDRLVDHLIDFPIRDQEIDPFQIDRDTWPPDGEHHHHHRDRIRDSHIIRPPEPGID